MPRSAGRLLVIKGGRSPRFVPSLGPAEVAWRPGREQYPTVRVPPGAFAAFVKEVHARVDEAQRETLDGAGLYLVCACTLGDTEALRVFEREFGALLKTGVPARLRRSPALPDDFQSMLRERLFVGVGGRPPFLLKYSGLGPLGGWLRTFVARAAISEARRYRALSRIQSEQKAAVLLTTPDPESVYLESRVRQSLAVALAAATQTLSPRERALIAMSLLHRISSRTLAQHYGVHHATVARWVQRASDKLVRGTRSRLCHDLRSGEHDLREVAHNVSGDAVGDLQGLLGCQ